MSDLELIFVNDESPDETESVANEFVSDPRFKYFSKKNGGPSSARNFALKIARGEFIAFLDDDDAWPLNKLEWQTAYLANNPSVVTIAGQSVFFESTPAESAASITHPTKKFTFFDLFSGNPFVSPGQLLVRRDVFNLIGGFREDIWGADDYEILFRIASLGEIHQTDQTALFYRFHGANASKNYVRMLEQTKLALKDHLSSLRGTEHYTLCKRRANLFLYMFGIRRQIEDQYKHNHSFRIRLKTILPPVLRATSFFLRHPRTLRGLYLTDMLNLTKRFFENKPIQKGI